MSYCVSQKPYEGPHYSARYVDKNDSVVLVTATGKNRTGGWKTHFEIEPTFVAPFRLGFVNCPPTGIATDMITPFEVHLSIKPIPNQKDVKIDDTEGGHTVKIERFLNK